MFQNVFQLINQIIYGFLFSKVERKGVFFQKTGFWKNIIINFYELFFSASLKKGIYETIHQNVFQLVNQIYLWVFIFRVAEKGYNTMQL